MPTPGLIPVAGETVPYKWSTGFLYGQRMGFPDKGEARSGAGELQVVFPNNISQPHALFIVGFFHSSQKKRGLDLFPLSWSGLVTMVGVTLSHIWCRVIKVMYLPPGSLGMPALGSQPPWRSHM